MKLPRAGITAAVGLACRVALVLPILAMAQASAPCAHLHAMPPMGSATAVAPDLMASMSKMHAEMEAMTLSGNMDRDFVMMMRRHHQGAIDMAKIELARGKDAKIKHMAAKMIADQTREIANLDKSTALHGARTK